MQLFVFPDGTIISADEFEVWTVDPNIKVDNVEDIQTAANNQHASKVLRVEDGNTVWKVGDGVEELYTVFSLGTQHTEGSG